MDISFDPLKNVAYMPKDPVVNNRKMMQFDPLGKLAYMPAPTKNTIPNNALPDYVKQKMYRDVLINTASGFLNGLNEAYMLKARSNSIENQARLNFMNTASRRRIENMQLGIDMQELIDFQNDFVGRQNAQLAASNFDMSVGDKRLIAHTYREVSKKMTDLNYEAYMNAFEEDKQAVLNHIAAMAEAKMARAAAKYSIISGISEGIASGAMSALGTYTNFKYMNAENEAAGRNKSKGVKSLLS